MELTNEQWELVEPLLPKRDRSGNRTGRPRVEARPVLEGILWVLRTGAPWKDLPLRFPSYQTCHRRYQQWVEEGVFDAILRALAQDLELRGRIDLSEGFIDGSFSSAKKGALALGRPSAEKAPNSWQLRTAMVFLSPYPLEVLRRMKSPLLKKRSPNT
jgi:transposase